MGRFWKGQRSLRRKKKNRRKIRRSRNREEKEKEKEHKKEKEEKKETRPDTGLPQSRAGGQGPYLRSVEHLSRSSKTKNPIIAKEVTV